MVTHRPELHITAPEGVLEAPAGSLLKDGTWHIMYQYEPHADGHGLWGHVTSPNFSPFNWTDGEDILVPEGEETDLWAGSVISDAGKVTLFFTSVKGDKTEIHRADVADGKATRAGCVVGDSDGHTNFRSPCVIARGAGWLMLAVSGPEDDPRPVILESLDTETWTLIGDLEFTGKSGLEGIPQLVSPRIIVLSDEFSGDSHDVLLVTVQFGEIDICGYLVGHLDGYTFDVETPFTRIDYGHDFSRPRTTNFDVTDTTSLEGAIVFGLMDGGGALHDLDRDPSYHSEKWVNCLSAPRLVTLQDGHLFQTPYPGLIAEIEKTERASLWSGMFSVGEGEISVALVDREDNIYATISHTKDAVFLDRSESSFFEDDEMAEAPVTCSDTQSMSILVDGSTVEVFADGGAATLSSRVYFDHDFYRFAVRTTGGAVLEQVVSD